MPGKDYVIVILVSFSQSTESLPARGRVRRRGGVVERGVEHESRNVGSLLVHLEHQALVLGHLRGGDPTTRHSSHWRRRRRIPNSLFIFLVAPRACVCVEKPSIQEMRVLEGGVGRLKKKVN